MQGHYSLKNSKKCHQAFEHLTLDVKTTFILSMKLYHLSKIRLRVKSHNKSIELGCLAWGEKRKWKLFQFFSVNIEHLKKIIILILSCYFTMHIRVFWLQIVEFDIFCNLELSLWIFICFHPFLFTCGITSLDIIRHSYLSSIP